MTRHEALDRIKAHVAASEAPAALRHLLSFCVISGRDGAAITLQASNEWVADQLMEERYAEHLAAAAAYVAGDGATITCEGPPEVDLVAEIEGEGFA